jgi:hypothetical protein
MYTEVRKEGKYDNSYKIDKRCVRKRYKNEKKERKSR